MIRDFLIGPVFQGISGDILTGLSLLCLAAAAGIIYLTMIKDQEW